MIETAWGYSMPDIDALPAMLRKDEFDEMTAGKYRSDVRVDRAIEAVTMAIRNHCGWHVNGPVVCELETIVKDLALYGTNNDFVSQLPAKFVQGVDEVTINGVEMRDYFCSKSGLLTVFDLAEMYGRKAKVKIKYRSGYPMDMIGSVKDLIANRVVNAISQSGGVQSETAGGVSISYSASWVNPDGAGVLTPAAKGVLEPYCRREVF